MGRKVFSSQTQINAVTSKSIEKIILSPPGTDEFTSGVIHDYYYYPAEGVVESVKQIHVYFHKLSVAAGATSGRMCVDLSAELDICQFYAAYNQETVYKRGELQNRASMDASTVPETDDTVNTTIGRTILDSSTPMRLRLSQDTTKNCLFSDMTAAVFKFMIEREVVA